MGILGVVRPCFKTFLTKGGMDVKKKELGMPERRHKLWGVWGGENLGEEGGPPARGELIDF